MKREIVKIDVGEISLGAAHALVAAVRTPPTGEAGRIAQLLSALSPRELELFSFELTHRGTT